jgi:hypothetical protein
MPTDDDDLTLEPMEAPAPSADRQPALPIPAPALEFGRPPTPPPLGRTQAALVVDPRRPSGFTPGLRRGVTLPCWRVASMSEAGTDATCPGLSCRNPTDPRLPYLLRLPIDGGLVLGCDTWPHRPPRAWARGGRGFASSRTSPSSPVRRARGGHRPRCRDSAPARLHDPANGRRFLADTQGGRRRSARIPVAARAGSRSQIVEDTREVPAQARAPAHTVREALPAGDYAVRDPAGLVVAAGTQGAGRPCIRAE